MALIPKQSIEELINEAIEHKIKKEYHRPYIGYSSLGGKCKRKIWYSFRWAKIRETSARMIRLYSRGDWEEHRIIADLENIGFKIFDKQKEIVGLAEHVFGHIDAKLRHGQYFDEDVLGEFKTANDKNFKLFVKNGCLNTNEEYYNQAQLYMGHENLNKTLFIVTNKNDEKRYFEIIDFEKDRFDELNGLSLSILESDFPFEKIGPPTWFECRFCEFKGICHYGEPVLKTCRSCSNAVIEEKGAWSCSKHLKFLTIEEQKKGCEDYSILESLI